MRANAALHVAERWLPEYCNYERTEIEPAAQDALESAQIAGLRYITDVYPGIRRKRSGRGFAYYDCTMNRIRSRNEIERITSLKIPPAWKDVWISPLSNGHLQATGRDDKGRKQYIYHPLWRTVRDQTKFNRMVVFGTALPRIRERTEQDLNLPGLPREKVIAAVVKLLERTLIRIGNKEYVRQNQSFGLTTMQDNHIHISGPILRFHFKGKSGKVHNVKVNDRRLARIVKKCRDIPGQELFRYVDEDGQHRAIDSFDVNAYLKEITDEQFTAKDFRTWGGTVHAAFILKQIGPFNSEAQARRNIVQAVKTVAEHLGNKPSVCRTYYIHPAIIDVYHQGLLSEMLEESMQEKGSMNDEPHQLSSLERAVLEILERSSANEQRQVV